MKTRIMTLALAGTFAFAAFGGVALAASPNQATPGTPGDKNCEGQTMAYLAQGNAVVAPGPGIGNVRAGSSPAAP